MFAAGVCGWQERPEAQERLLLEAARERLLHDPQHYPPVVN